MDEQLDYSGEDQLRRASSNWMLNRGTGSMTNLEAESSKLFLQYKNYHIHLVKKKESREDSERPIIPASKYERLAFYRSYAGTPKKLEITTVEISSYNGYIWQYIFNMFLKTLPHTFVHVFLASFAPHEHIFVPKMVPFFYGFKAAVLITSLLELLIYVYNCMFNMSYILKGIIFKNPWNRCSNEYRFGNLTVNCYLPEEFGKKIANTNATFNDFYYISSDGEYFQLPQILYYVYASNTVTFMTRFVNFVLIWIPIVFFCSAVNGKRFWKVLNKVHIAEVLIEVVVCVFLFTADYNENEDATINSMLEDQSSFLSMLFGDCDADVFAESTTAPPVVHVITTRSTDEIVASRDSSEMVVSNAIFYLFRFALVYKLNTYCQSFTKAPIQMNELNSRAFYFIWPIFFSTFYLGDIYTITFYMLNLASDLTTVIVTYYCFFEMIINEWKWIKRWMLTIFFTLFFMTVYYFMDYDILTLVFLYAKGITTFVEVLVIYYFYPVGRLVDDITFHHGAPPTTLRILCLQIMPVYYSFKLYLFIKGFMKLMEVEGTATLKLLSWSWVLGASPLIAGFIVVSYKYIVKDKSGWARMFIPDNNWGPEDHELRQLRKEYDSRYYIASQAQRRLSRYMIAKYGCDAYQLDLNYDPGRRSTVATSKYHLEAEKKNL